MWKTQPNAVEKRWQPELQDPKTELKVVQDKLEKRYMTVINVQKYIIIFMNSTKL